MHPLEKKISRVIRTHDLIKPGERVVAGVSGGPDSMALLHVLAALEVKLQAVYVDHGLRPAETPVEAELVRASANSLGIACEVVKADVSGLAKEEQLSIEHAARVLRYDVFSRVADTFSAKKVAVGHTADDQAEEILLRLIRGTGRRGLSGMERMTEKGIIRPFLGVPKVDLLDYITDRGIRFAKDSSNKERRFLRNRVRLDLLPYLEDNFHQGIRGTLRRTARILTDEEEYLADAARKAYLRVLGGSPKKQDEISVECRAILDEPMALQRRVIEQALINLQTKPSGRKIENILKLAVSAERNATLHLAQGLRIIKESGKLNFAFPRGRSRFRGDTGNKEVPQFNFIANGVGRYLIPGTEKEIVLEIIDRLPTKKELAQRTVEYLDAGIAGFPLIIRSPQPGDRIQPLGGTGRKKLSDIFIDQKIPRNQRYGPVIVSGEEIVAVPGKVISQKARITSRTGRVLLIRSPQKK